MTAPTIEPARLVDKIRERQKERRLLVAIAGPPGAGKSTFAAWLDRQLNAHSTGLSAVLSMDGYHFDDTVLKGRGLIHRKGAPNTFDIDGLAAMLARLKADEGRSIAVPVFDRGLEIARAGARIIEGTVRIVLVEGNYLLLDDPDWAPLQSHFDMTVLLAPPMALLQERLMRRWRDLGLSEQATRRKVQENDLPNCRLVLDGGKQPDFVIEAAG